MNSAPLISVIVETYNATPAAEIRLDQVLTRLKEQSYPADRIEIIVVVDEANPELVDSLARNWPDVRVAQMSDGNYFAMKNCGLRFAQGEVVAFLDGDCMPSLNWAERIAFTLRKGADVAVGKTRYPSDKPFARTFDLFDFGHVQSDENGEANCFVANNVAFKKEVIREHNFDHRLGRSGGCYLLSRQLKSLDHKLVYDPHQFTVHDYNIKGLGFITKRIRLGYDAINLCRLDSEGVMPENKVIKLGFLAPFAIFASRVLFDFKRIVSNRQDLDIPVLAIPGFYVASILMRSIEVIGGIITVARPDYFRTKFGW